MTNCCDQSPPPENVLNTEQQTWMAWSLFGAALWSTAALLLIRWKAEKLQNTTYLIHIEHYRQKISFFTLIILPPVLLPSLLWRCWLGSRKGIQPVKKFSGGMLAWLCVWVKVQICIWPRWCHCHSLYLAPVNPHRVYLPGFTFLVPAHQGSPGQNPRCPSCRPTNSVKAFTKVNFIFKLEGAQRVHTECAHTQRQSVNSISASFTPFTWRI